MHTYKTNKKKHSYKNLISIFLIKKNTKNDRQKVNFVSKFLNFISVMKIINLTKKKHTNKHQINKQKRHQTKQKIKYFFFLIFYSVS